MGSFFNFSCLFFFATPGSIFHTLFVSNVLYFLTFLIIL